MKISDKLLNQLPKVELHCHLDGSLRVDSILDIAQKNNIELPTTNKDKLKNLLSIGNKRVTLEEYIARFDITLSVMQLHHHLIGLLMNLLKMCLKKMLDILK